MKKLLFITIPVLIIIGLSIFLFFRKEPSKTYSVYLKTDAMIRLNFKIDKNVSVVTAISLLDDKAREIYKDTEFLNFDVNDCIKIYMDKLKEQKLDFDVINIWTDYDNKEFFKTEVLLNMSIVKTDELDNTINNIKAELIYNKPYYLTAHKNNFSITFMENGQLRYQIDEHIQKVCDEIHEDDCFDMTIDTKYYEKSSNNNVYSIDNNILTIEAKENESYFGWVYSYDKCELIYNKLKCDHYNGYSGGPYDLKYRYTEYYELR